MYKGYPQARSDTPFLMGESSKTARTGFILIVQSPSLSNNIPLLESEGDWTITYPYPDTTSACYSNGRLPCGPETPCRSGNKATTSEPGNGMTAHARIPPIP